MIAHRSVATIIYHKVRPRSSSSASASIDASPAQGLDAALVVRQFRPAVYASACAEQGVPVGQLPLEHGFTFELCAGILGACVFLPPAARPCRERTAPPNADKSKGVAEIAREEVLEECGFDVPLASMEEVSAFVSASGEGPPLACLLALRKNDDANPKKKKGTSGSRQHMFYTEVDDSQRVDDGGGVDGEAIEVVAVPMSRLDAFVLDPAIGKSPGLMFGLTWLRHIRRRV